MNSPLSRLVRNNKPSNVGRGTRAPPPDGAGGPGSRRRTRCNAPVFRRQREGQIITNLLNVLGRDEHYMAAEHNQRLVLIQEMLEIRAAA